MLLAPPGNVVIVSIAVQDAPAPVLRLAPAGVHVTAPDSEVDPFLNCTVPVGPCTLLLFEETVAVNVTLPPATIEPALAVTTVDVTAGVIISISVLLVG